MVLAAWFYYITDSGNKQLYNNLLKELLYFRLIIAQYTFCDMMDNTYFTYWDRVTCKDVSELSWLFWVLACRLHGAKTLS